MTDPPFREAVNIGCNGRGMIFERVFSRGHGAAPKRGSAEAANMCSAPVASQTELLLTLNGCGDVLSTAPSDHEDLGPLRDTLLGRGLFHALRIGDRPAFLKAVSDTHADGQERSFQAVLQTGRPTISLSCQIQVRAQGEVVLAALCVQPQQDLGATDTIRQLSLMAHEFRAPLTAIKGFADMLAHAPDAVDAARLVEYAGFIQQSAEHLNQVVERSLSLGCVAASDSQTELNLAEIPLIPFIDQCLTLIAPALAAQGIAFGMTVEDGLDRIIADEQGLRQVLLNLLDNARKFSAADASVHLTIAVREGHLHFRIEDHGIGIPDEALNRLGRPFERVAGTGVAGTGLGLAMVNQFAALHGGRLELESVLGEGTVATLILPRVRGSATVSRLDDRSAAPSHDEPHSLNPPSRTQPRSAA